MKRMFGMGLLLCLTLCSCGTAPASSVAAPPSSEPEQASSAQPEPAAKALNPLTGLFTMEESAVGKRPIACMVSNMKEALPQYGVGSADILYEAVCEGGITRMVAVFADAGAMPRTGPVRSTRNYYLDFALGHDAVIAHFGTSNLAAAKIKNEKINNVDGMTSGAFWRDQDIRRAKGLEHSAFTQGSKLQADIAKKGYRTDSRQKNTAFSFADKPVVPAAQACSTAKIPFTGYCQGTFTYDEAKKVYLKSEFGSPQKDALTGEQLAVTNVFILFDSITEVGDEAQHMQAALQSGDGYYISMGGAAPIKWSKGKSTAPFTYQDAGGGVLSVNPGKSWVCLVSKSQKDKVTLL